MATALTPQQILDQQTAAKNAAADSSNPLGSNPNPAYAAGQATASAQPSSTTGRMDYSDPSNPNGTYIPNGSSAPAASPAGGDGSSGFISPYYSRTAGATAEPVQTAVETEEQAQQRLQREAQGEIDSVNKYYDSLVADQGAVNDRRNRSTNAISTLTGLAGSTEADQADNTTRNLNKSDLEKINNERAVKVAGIFSNIRSSAATAAKNSRDESRQSAEDILSFRTAKQNDAVKNLSQLAQSGATLDGIKATDPESYQYLIDAVGGPEQAKSLMILNRPKNDLVGQPTRIGDHYVQMYKNPLTGAVTTEEIKLPFNLPAEYKTFQKLGDNLVAIPDGWDGDPSKLKTIYGAPSGGSGVYVPGQNPAADAWIKGINNGSRNIKDVPTADLKNLVIQGLTSEVNSSGASELKTNALTSAQALLDKFTKGQGTSAVGKSGFADSFGYGLIPGTQRADFTTQFDNLKALLSLDNVKLLKGQGAVSDSERQLLADASSKLSLAQSEPEFQAALNDIIKALSGAGAGAGAGAADTNTSPPKGTDGSAYGFPGYESDGNQWVPKSQ